MRVPEFLRRILAWGKATAQKTCVVDLSALPEDKRRQVRAAQLETVYQLTPTAILLNLFNMSLIAATISHHIEGPAMILWVTATILAVTMVFLVWRRSRVIYRTRAPASAIRVIVVLGSLRAGVWALGLVAFFPAVDPLHQLIIGLTAVGMMAGGAFGLSTVPPAGVAYVVIVAIGGMAALVQTGIWELQALTALIVSFAFFLIRHVRHHGRLFIEHWKSRVVADEQRETIAMLLNEYEENGSDWLWQTDAEGRFVKASVRFAEAAGRDVSSLEGLSFAALFSPSTDACNARALTAIAGRNAMQDAIVGIDVGTERRFWSLTARPLADTDGNFIGFRGVATDVTEKVRSAQKLENLAHFDQLTGLANRVRFSEIMTRAFATEVRDLALMIVDFNGFKSINDTLGHPVGDGLLREIGLRFREWAAEGVDVARLGGDEFAVLVKGDARRRAEPMAADLMRVLDRPYDVAPHNLAINACIGVALAGADAPDPQTLMKNADLALYAAKAKGGSQFSFFEYSMAARMLRRQRLEYGLRKAVRDNELSLMFQPIVDLRSGKVRAFEALVRWNSAEFGEVGPEEFIPIAEDSGMIVEIGEWVLKRAVAEAATWPSDIQVSINISPAQLRDNKLLAFMVRCLDDSGLLPSRLEIEITEGVFLESSEHIERTLRALLELGVRIALDDFGTGYSSLSYLRSFPFSKVKIDKSFVDGMADNQSNISIIKAIIDMAASLGFDVVAEGVETPAQLAALTRLGCDYVQGYLFAPPQHAGALTVLTGADMMRTARGGAGK